MKKILRAVIVDDYSDQIDTLKGKLENSKGVSVVATAETIDEATKVIRLHKPDLVFLDINMYENGKKRESFTIIKTLEEEGIFFKVIFVTGFPQEYALKGYDFQPIDFLAKSSFTRDRLQQAIDKCRELIALEEATDPIKKERKIALKVGYGFVFFKRSDIIYAKIDNTRTELYTVDKQTFTLINHTRVELESCLDDDAFLHIHRSYIINLAHINAYSRSAQEVTMSNGHKISVGQDGRDYFSRLK